MAFKYLNKLQGQRVVIIGGSSGIGYGIAEAAVEYGATVTIASSKPDKVQSAVTRLQQTYPDAAGRVNGQAVDLGADNVEEQLTSLFDLASAGGKHKVNHVAHTAGAPFKSRTLDEITPESLAMPLKLSFVGTMMLAKIAARYLDRSPGSSLTLTGGVNDVKPTAGWVAVAPIGGATRGLTHALAHDMKPVRVNMVAPGAVKTELFDHFADDGIEDFYKAKTLTGSIGKPQDLGEVYVSIMKSEFVDGTEITVDGGYMLV